MRWRETAQSKAEKQTKEDKERGRETQRERGRGGTGQRGVEKAKFGRESTLRGSRSGLLFVSLSKLGRRSVCV